MHDAIVFKIRKLLLKNRMFCQIWHLFNKTESESESKTNNLFE